MKKWIAVIAAALTGGVAEAGAQGLLSEHLTAALVGLIAAAVTEFARRMPAGSGKGPGFGPIAIVLCVGLAGCSLVEKATGFLGAQYAQYGAQAEQMFNLLCGRSEAEARGRSFRGVEEERAFIDDVCRSEEAIQTYGPLVLEALEQGQGRAMARARARAAE